MNARSIIALYTYGLIFETSTQRRGLQYSQMSAGSVYKQCEKDIAGMCLRNDG